MSTIPGADPAWQTHELAVLYKFSKESADDIFRQLRATPGCGSTKCLYNDEEDIFEITCLLEQSERNISTLSNLVEGLIVQELNHVEISDHGSQIATIAAAFIHTESFDQAAASMQPSSEKLHRSSSVSEKGDQFHRNQNNSPPLYWKPKYSDTDMSLAASPHKLTYLEHLSGCRLALDKSSSAILISGGNDRKVGELFDKLDTIEEEQKCHAASEHIMHHEKTSDRFSLRVATLGSLTDGSLGRILIPTDWGVSQDQPDIRMLKRMCVIRLLTYDTKSQKFVEAKRSVTAPRAPLHLVNRGAWSGFDFCIIGEGAPQIVKPEQPPTSNLLPSWLEAEDTAEVPIDQWRQQVEPYYPPEFNIQDSTVRRTTLSRDLSTSWENYVPERPAIFHGNKSEPTNSIIAPTAAQPPQRAYQVEPFPQSPIRRGQSPSSRSRTGRLRRSGNKPPRAPAHQSRGSSHRGDRGQARSAPVYRGLQRGRQNNRISHGRGSRGTPPQNTVNRFQLIEVDDGNYGDQEGFTSGQEYPPGYAPGFMGKDEDNPSGAVLSYPALGVQSSNPVEGENKISKTQTDTEALTTAVNGLQLLAAGEAADERSGYRATATGYVATTSSIRQSANHAYDEEQVAVAKFSHAEEKEELEPRVRFSTGKKRAPAPSRKSGGKTPTASAQKAFENLKLEFDSTKPVPIKYVEAAKRGLSRSPEKGNDRDIQSHENIPKVTEDEKSCTANEKLLEHLRKTMESARIFRGRIRMRVQIGQILIPDAQVHVDSRGAAISWSEMKDSLLSFRDSEIEPVKFTKAVTSSALETEALLDLCGVAEQEAYSREAHWELCCRASDGSEMRINVDALNPSTEPMIILGRKLLGAVYVHAVSSVHDAKFEITGTLFAKNMSTVPGVESIVKSMFVQPQTQQEPEEPAENHSEALIDLADTSQASQSTTVPTLIARDGELYVEAVCLKSMLRYQIPAPENARKHYIELVRVHDLPIDRADVSAVENAGIFRARGLSDSALITAQRLWYEINLGEVETAPEFEENEIMKLGERATWCWADVLDETSVAGLEKLTRTLLDKMDCIGFSNEGPGFEMEKRKAATKAKKEAEGKLQEDEFW